MIDIGFDIDLEDVLDGFDDMKRQSKNLTKVWQDVGPDLKKDVKAHGRKKQGPDKSWAPLSRATKLRRKATRKRGRKPAVAVLGKIRTSFTVEWGRLFIRAVSRIPFSGAHQDGAVVGRGTKLPARSPLFASKEFLDLLVDRVLIHMIRVF